MISALSSVRAPTTRTSPLSAISTLPASALLPERDSATLFSVPPVALSCVPSINCSALSVPPLIALPLPAVIRRPPAMVPPLSVSAPVSSWVPMFSVPPDTVRRPLMTESSTSVSVLPLMTMFSFE